MVVAVARIARIQECVVAAHLAADLDVNVLVERLLGEPLSRLANQMLHCLHIAHDAGNHQA